MRISTPVIHNKLTGNHTIPQTYPCAKKMEIMPLMWHITTNFIIKSYCLWSRSAWLLTNFGGNQVVYYCFDSHEHSQKAILWMILLSKNDYVVACCGNQVVYYCFDSHEHSQKAILWMILLSKNDYVVAVNVMSTGLENNILLYMELWYWFKL